MYSVVLILFSNLLFAQCQFIPGGSCENKKTIESDVLTKVRELQLEVSSCQKKSLSIERLLNRDLTKIKDQLNDVVNALDLGLTGE